MPKLTPIRIIGGVAAGGVLALVVGGLVVAALFAWCLPHFGESVLVGVYLARYHSGTETLTLSADGTFLQEVMLKEPQDGAPITRTGSWTWDESKQTLRLFDCMDVNNGSGDINPAFRSEGSGCSYTAERRWWFFGQILLGDRDSAPLWKVN